MDIMLESLLSVNQPINEIADYEFGKNIKAYLRQKLSLKDPKLIMRPSGSGNICKFRKHTEEWLSFTRPIPEKFLETIGVDWKILEYVAELDRENFRRAINLPRYPRYVIVRLMPAIYQTKPLPAGIAETDAIELVKSWIKEKPFQCMINYPELLTISIDASGVRFISYEPIITIKNHMVSFGITGRRIGTTRIG